MFGVASVDAHQVAVYIRWSTEEQGSGTTLEVQRDACRHFLLSQGWQFREELVFIDDGYSGANLDRPAMGKLRAAIQEGRVAAVVVYKLDRLSRNLLDCVTLVRQEWRQVALYSTMERFDTQSSLGQMVFNMLVSFAEFERNVIRERTMSGKRKRRDQGRNSGFKYPYGYRKSAEGGFEIDAPKAEIVRRIFAEYLSGTGMHAIAIKLNEDGIPAPAGGLWRQATISLMLQNPYYPGHYAAGYYSYEGGKQRRAKQPGFVKKNAVPAIITQAEFDRAQEARRRRYRAGSSSPRASEYLLSGVMRCRQCGGRMIGHNGNSTRRYYLCATAKQLGKCVAGSVPAQVVEEQVLEAVRGRYAPERLLEHLAALEGQRRLEIAGRQCQVANLKRRLAEARERRQRLDDDYLGGELHGKQYARLVEQVEETVAEVTEQAEAAQERLREAQQTPVDRERIRSLMNQIDVLNELAPHEVRKLLRQLLSCVRAYRPKTKGRWNGAPIDLEIEHRVEHFPLATGPQNGSDPSVCTPL